MKEHIKGMLRDVALELVKEHLERRYRGASLIEETKQSFSWDANEWLSNLKTERYFEHLPKLHIRWADSYARLSWAGADCECDACRS